MSSMTLSPRISHAPSRGSRRPSGALRLTRRGRLVLLAGFVLLASLALTQFASLAAATQEGGTSSQVQVVRVAPGDTLYGIAQRVGGAENLQQTVYEIEQLNSLPGPQVRAGQDIAVPAGD